MALTSTRYEHIVIDDRGVPQIAGTTMKVIELVLAERANGWNPAELQSQFPHLSLGQIHSALAYYWDHQAELDQDIDRRLAAVDALKRSMPIPPAIARLKAEHAR
jgi:uncharacterized protein (DUF433 family)